MTSPPSDEARRVVRWPQGGVDEDRVVTEEPLEVRVEGASIAITMRTPGHDQDLALGFLYTEGVIDGPDDVAAIAPVTSDSETPSNIINVRLASGVEAHAEALERATRALYATSSCGLCGKASLDRIRVLSPPLTETLEVNPEVLLKLPDLLREAQQAFGATGGLHAAALFDAEGKLEVIREDVGRHNAVDKVLGWRLQQDAVPVDDRILVVSSRAGFEIVHKARVARIPIVAALGAATTLAIDLADDGGQALIGWLSDTRFTRYT